MYTSIATDEGTIVSRQHNEAVCARISRRLMKEYIYSSGTFREKTRKCTRFSFSLSCFTAARTTKTTSRTISKYAGANRNELNVGFANLSYVCVSFWCVFFVFAWSLGLATTPLTKKTWTFGRFLLRFSRVLWEVFKRFWVGFWEVFGRIFCVSRKVLESFCEVSERKCS